MLRTLRIGTVLTALVAVVSIAIFLYLTRGVAAPTEAIQDSARVLTTGETTNFEVVYRISQADSRVTYTIQEVLNGADKTVVGTTSQIAGDILINLRNPSQLQLGKSVSMPAPLPPMTPAVITRSFVSSSNPNPTPTSTSSSSLRPSALYRIGST